MLLYEKLKMLASIAKKQDCRKIHFRFDINGNYHTLQASRITVQNTGVMTVTVDIPYNLFGVSRVSLFHNGKELYTEVRQCNLGFGDSFTLTFTFKLGE